MLIPCIWWNWIICFYMMKYELFSVLVFCVCLYPSWNIFIHTETSPLPMNYQYLYRSKHNTAVFITKKRHLLYFLSIGVLFPCINREARGNSWHFNKFNYNLQQIKTCYLGTAATVIIVACGKSANDFVS